MFQPVSITSSLEQGPSVLIASLHVAHVVLALVHAAELVTLRLLLAVSGHALSHAREQCVVHLGCIVDLIRVVSGLRKGCGRGGVATVGISAAVIRGEGGVRVEEWISVERLSPARSTRRAAKAL